MSDQPKRGRKPATPNLDAVVKAIERGAYDEQILELHESLAARRDVLRARILERVHEVFGPEAVIVMQPPLSTGATDDIPQPENIARNPFIMRARSNEEKKELPGPYRIDPDDGNAYRLDDREPETGADDGRILDPAYVWISDIFGGHRRTILRSDWEKWDLQFETGDSQISDPLTNSDLDETEKKMQQEAQTDRSPGRGGAVIGGMSASDMGD